MLQKLKGLITEEKGQGMTEYGLLLGLLAVAAVAAIAVLRDEIVAMFEDAKTVIVNRETGGTP